MAGFRKCKNLKRTRFPYPQQQHKEQFTIVVKNICNYYVAITNQQSNITKKKPEWPDVSTAVPKKSIFSVREAWTMQTENIRPPALTKTHCSSEAGKICPGYFALRSLCTFWYAFFTSNAAVASAYKYKNHSCHLILLPITSISQLFVQMNICWLVPT